MSSYMVYVGTYTHSEQASRSDGIFIYRLDGSTGTLTFAGVTNAGVNPSYLTISADHRFLYAVNEVNEFNGQSGGGLAAFAVDSRSGLLHALNTQPTSGMLPCYVSSDAEFAFVANYGEGSISVLPIDIGGYLSYPVQIVRHQGRSVNPLRQTAPHMHSVVPDASGQYLLAADLGIDKIVIYRRNRLSTTTPLVKVNEVSVEAGSGPRHLSFHPTGRFLYVANELTSTVGVFSYNATEGTLHALQSISALPGDYGGTNYCADIHVNPGGTYLYVSNRGHDSIAVYSIDQAGGKLTKVGFVSTQGKTPRNFAFDVTGTWLVVANQDSDNLVVFKADQVTGTLSPVAEVATVPQPTCVKIAQVALLQGPVGGQLSLYGGKTSFLHSGSHSGAAGEQFGRATHGVSGLRSDDCSSEGRR